MASAVLGQTISFSVTSGDVIYIDAGGVGSVNLYVGGKQVDQRNFNGSQLDISVINTGTASIYLASGACNYFVNQVENGLSVLSRDQAKKSTSVASVGNRSVYNEDGNAIGPVYITGIFKFGQTLTASLAPGWSVTGYQWTRNGVDISGATNSTYVLSGADIGNSVTVKVSGLIYTGQDVSSVVYDGPDLLRFATAFNKIASGSVGVASGEERRVAARMHRPIGSSAKKSLQINANNFFLSGIDAITIPPTALNVVACYIECNGVSVPVTWGGVANPSFAAGAADMLSDKVYPIQFGLANFNRDRVVYLRLEVSVPAGGNIPVSEGIESLSNCRSFYVSSGACTNISGVGALTFTGTTSATFELPFLIVGEDVSPSSDLRSWIGIGDSVYAQGGPSSYFQQGLAGTGTNYISGCTISKVGAVANMFIANASTLGKYVKYANGAVEEYGTNMVGSSLGTIQSNLQSVWSLIKANKSTHPQSRDIYLMRAPLMNRTTDATGATVFSSLWNASGIVEQLNDWFDTQVGSPTGVTAVASNLMSSPNLMRRGSGTKGVADSDYYKWPNAITGDGLHPSLTGASGTNGLGANLRVYLVAAA